MVTKPAEQFSGRKSAKENYQRENSNKSAKKLAFYQIKGKELKDFRSKKSLKPLVDNQRKKIISAKTQINQRKVGIRSKGKGLKDF